MIEKQVIAVCGKGGVGKTSFSALLGRSLIDYSIRPILFVDADPVMGLTYAIGERNSQTLSDVRDQLIISARASDKALTKDIADQIDYLVLKTLVERDNYSLLAMGHSAEKGCFCPANSLLRKAIDLISTSFQVVLIDAEAGIEQINRDVTHGVNTIITVVDGSRQSINTLNLISKMMKSCRLYVVANRIPAGKIEVLPEEAHLLGSVPDDPAIRQFNQEGRSLWELPPDNDALIAVVSMMRKLGLR
ncbi:MAG: AAA family ATPase [Dehalococcoidia bacterium]|jgi:CO dehydrogenase maturation factor